VDRRVLTRAPPARAPPPPTISARGTLRPRRGVDKRLGVDVGAPWHSKNARSPSDFGATRRGGALESSVESLISPARVLHTRRAFTVSTEPSKRFRGCFLQPSRPPRSPHPGSGTRALAARR
jgi:hypothetical protein